MQIPEHLARSREGGCMLVTCYLIWLEKIPILCMFGDHRKAGRGYLPACCCLHSCWKAGVPRTRPVLRISCNLWQCLWDRLLTNVRDLGQRGVSRTLQMVIGLSPGKSQSTAQEGLARGVQDNLFLCCFRRKDSLCQGRIYLGSFVLVRPFRPSFDLIYLLILGLYYVQDSAALFFLFSLFRLLEEISRKLPWK